VAVGVCNRFGESETPFLRNEYLAAENRILQTKLPARLRFDRFGARPLRSDRPDFVFWQRRRKIIGAIIPTTTTRKSGCVAVSRNGARVQRPESYLHPVMT